jgi:hypothetical protein
MAVIIFGFLSEVHGKKVEGFFNDGKGQMQGWQTSQRDRERNDPNPHHCSIVVLYLFSLFSYFILEQEDLL